jgi:hypothetical protein
VPPRQARPRDTENCHTGEPAHAVGRHQRTEGARAPELLPGVDRKDDGRERTDEEVSDHGHDEQCAHDRLTHDECNARAHLLHVALATHAAPGRCGHDISDGCGADEERPRVEPERTRRPDGRNQRSGERRPDDVADVLRAGVKRVRALERGRGSLGQTGDQRLACGLARRVEQRAEEAEHEDVPEREPAGREEERNRRDRGAAQEVA